MMQETHTRSVVKAVSYRLFGTVSTFVISFIITQEFTFALYIGIFEFVSKIGLFYAHERLWGVIPFGRKAVNTPTNTTKSDTVEKEEKTPPLQMATAQAED